MDKIKSILIIVCGMIMIFSCASEELKEETEEEEEKEKDD